MPRRYWNPNTNRWENTPPSSGGQQQPTQISFGGGGGGGGGVGGGAAAGAATGATLGTMIAPGIGTLIGGLAGAGLGAAGAGIQGAEEEKKYEDQMAMVKRQQEETEKQNAFNRYATRRNMNMAGLDALAAFRTQAMQGMKGQMFADDLIRAFNGR